MPNRKRKLLIVDDEPATRFLLSEIFRGLGHTVLCAEDGLSALEQIRETMPDIILSDLNMPRMSGFEFLSIVRRRLPSIYVIASSGAYTGDAIPSGIAADAFYQKATNLHALLRLIEAEEGPSVASRPAGAAAPIWIATEGDNPRDEQTITISCPECLRTFHEALEEASGPVQGARDVRETVCASCGTTIHYAIVRTLDPVSEQEYHAKLDAILPEIRLLSTSVERLGVRG